MTTPMMRQYNDIKGQYKDHVVFFRLGDFYEMFNEDAILCSRVLEIALTSRDAVNKVPMAGVPYHAADQYIAKLVTKGYKVVICEQVEDPKLSKGLVKREVVKIVTPGTITDIKALEESRNNYLGCIVKDKSLFGLAFVDLTTGDFHVTELISHYPYSELLNELAKYNVTECLICPFAKEDKTLMKKLDEVMSPLWTAVSKEDFGERKALDTLSSSAINKDSLDKLSTHKQASIASGTCLSYLTDTHNNLYHINSINFYETLHFMGLDIFCRNNLELTKSLRDGKKTGSLLGVLDNTHTSMGARLLRRWLEQPLIELTGINDRHEAVGELFDDFFLREELIGFLKEVHDLERLTGKLACGNINARDLLSIKNSVQILPKIKQRLSTCKTGLLIFLAQQTDPLEDVFELLHAAVAEEPPVSVKESGIIKDGYNPEIDKLRRASGEGKLWLADLEKRERDKTGIKSLKVGFNRVFGYYIEITKSNLASVPADYTRKQTLANSERYITEELKEYETLILNAQERLVDLEYEEFCRLREMLIQQIPRLKQSSYAVSNIDVLLSLALSASKNNYIRPEMTSGHNIDIVEGRHPVVEHFQRDIAFIPNDTHIDNVDTMISIITGPNMAGKSTYMRQVALIVLMAQMGSFVPAKRAAIGVVDKIFTRIGASDNLSSGQSTFMVEMMEVSEILKNSTKRSLLILDEVGRGTGTFDGLSIAWAVLEYIHAHIGAKTLFATHYYELTALKSLAGIKNFRITVKEKGEEVIFLRKIIPGETDKSYGVQVARLAGLPGVIVKRAQELLSEDEMWCRANLQRAASIDECAEVPSGIQGVRDLMELEVIRDIKNVDINTISPLEALNLLYNIKSKLD